jgi:hypothetical protein
MVIGDGSAGPFRSTGPIPGMPPALPRNTCTICTPGP